MNLLAVLAVLSIHKVYFYKHIATYCRYNIIITISLIFIKYFLNMKKIRLFKV